MAGGLPTEIFSETELLRTPKDITISCSLEMSVFKVESLLIFTILLMRLHKAFFFLSLCSIPADIHYAQFDSSSRQRLNWAEK